MKDIIERLMDFENEGITSSDRYHLRTDAAMAVFKLREALLAFQKLSWMPDAAPGPSCYMVEPVHEARKALQTAGVLLDGKSSFPSDINGSVMTIGGLRSVWLDGCAYSEASPHLVPEKHRATFTAALAK